MMAGNGDGTFGAPGLLESLEGARNAVTADFDANGSTDVAVVGQLSPSVSVVLTGCVDGS